MLIFETGSPTKMGRPRCGVSQKCYRKRGEGADGMGPPAIAKALKIARTASAPPRWRIDNYTLANDTVHRLAVDGVLNHFEFELVISGQRLAGFR
jgi:hypothetical protein